MCIASFRRAGSTRFKKDYMNKRDILKEDLVWLGIYNQGSLLKFKRMYSHDNLERSITEVINNMADEKLDWAIQQVKNTIDKFSKM